MRWSLSALVLLVAGVLTPATSALAAPEHASNLPAPPSFGIRLVDIPVAEAADPRALRYVIDHLPPGAVIRRRVLVQNFSRSVAHVAIYPDGAKITHGSFIGDDGQARSELTTWTTTSHHVLTLAPHASAMDAVTIRVPRDASPGERYGVIWAQETTQARASRRVAVTEVNRVGVRIYLSVGPGGAPPTNFAISDITGSREKNGDPVVAARVSNTGGRAIDLSGRLKLSDGPGGVSAGPFPIQHGTTLAPGQTGQIWTVLGKRLPDGPWRATVDLVSGLTERKASATIDFAVHKADYLLWWLGLAAILIILAGLIGAYLWRRRKRRSAGPSDMPTESGVPVG